MAMSRPLRDLEKLSDDELVRLHDDLAKNTVVGTDYYLDEWRRRHAARAVEASDRLARAAYRLSWMNLAVAIVAVVVSVAAIIATR